MNLTRIGLATLAAFVAYFAVGSVFFMAPNTSLKLSAPVLECRIAFVNYQTKVCFVLVLDSPWQRRHS